MDFEMRWLERKPIPVGEAARVLQYRYRIMTMGNGYRQVGAGDGNTYVTSYERPMGWTWSEWQDVPVQISSDGPEDK
jgi:hypothetical protein